VISLPHDSAIELVLLVGRVLAGMLFDLLLLVHFLSAPPVFRAPLRLTDETNA
jgi:hypothetical protein